MQRAREDIGNSRKKLTSLAWTWTKGLRAEADHWIVVGEVWDGESQKIRVLGGPSEAKKSDSALH